MHSVLLRDFCAKVAGIATCRYAIHCSAFVLLLKGSCPNAAQVNVTPTGVAVVRMDVQGEKQNTFNEEFVDDMRKMIAQVEGDNVRKC